MKYLYTSSWFVQEITMQRIVLTFIDLNLFVFNCILIRDALVIQIQLSEQLLSQAKQIELKTKFHSIVELRNWRQQKRFVKSWKKMR